MTASAKESASRSAQDASCAALVPRQDAFGTAINYPLPPVSSENGQIIAAADAENAANCRADSAAGGAFFIHESPQAGTIFAPPEADVAAELDALAERAAVQRRKRGRPAAFDDHAKGKLVALLALGLSMRQAAAQLGVCHATVGNTIKADPALAEEIAAARYQAQLEPLGCVIRESRRSWKAATWLLTYLERKLGSREETFEERLIREEEQS